MVGIQKEPAVFPRELRFQSGFPNTKGKREKLRIEVTVADCCDTICAHGVYAHPVHSAPVGNSHVGLVFHLATLNVRAS
jgi:hypothetical protein